MGSDKQSYFRRRSTNSKAYSGNEKATCKEGRRNDDTHSEGQGRQATEHGETCVGEWYTTYTQNSALLPCFERTFYTEQNMRFRSKRFGIGKQTRQRSVCYPWNGRGNTEIVIGRFFSIKQAETAHFDYLNNKDSACEHALIKEMLNHSDTIVNPIYFWSDSEIWEYIRRENIKINPLYYPPYNYKRVGCLLCPMASYAEKKKQEVDFPGYKKLYIHIFDKMLKIRKERGLENRSAWATGEDVYNWWIEEYKHNVKGQISIEEWLRNKDG